MLLVGLLLWREASERVLLLTLCVHLNLDSHMSCVQPEIYIQATHVPGQL